jgi:hypothetical protein
MCVSKHKCMEAMLGISLYSYLYLNLVKTVCLLLIFYAFSSPNQRTSGWNRVCLETGEGGIRVLGVGEAQAMYTHVNKCKNGKTKEEKNKERKEGRKEEKTERTNQITSPSYIFRILI